MAHQIPPECAHIRELFSKCIDDEALDAVRDKHFDACFACMAWSLAKTADDGVDFRQFIAPVRDDLYLVMALDRARRQGATHKS